MWKQGKTLVIVTGASRGLGQAIAVQMAHAIADPTLLLISRSSQDLKTTKNLCQNANDQCIIKLETMDLNIADVQDMNAIIEKIDFTPFNSLILVHNAGSIGNQGTKMVDFDKIQVMQDYYRLNVFSVMLLNSVVYKKSKNIDHKLVINISSIAAIQPFETWGSYCSAKAARDMLFKNMAVEEPSWTVLNYAPGPLDTNMVKDILEDQGTHANIRKAFENMTILKPETSAKRLVEILTKNTFKSGSHVDYFDEM